MQIMLIVKESAEEHGRPVRTGKASPRKTTPKDGAGGNRAGRPRGKAKPRQGRRRLGRTLSWVVVFGIWAGVGLAGLVAWYATDLPEIDAAITATRRPSITVLAADGSQLATAGDLFGVPVQAGDLPQALSLAVLAIEDRRFYDHFGVDLQGLLRAALTNLRAGGIVQGGSTITQQVAKNLFLTPERTLKRKIQEVLLALWLERRFSKDQILSLYLNRAYFGAGTYGVDAAARKYFGVPATRVSTYQAAMLAGLLRAPSRYNPKASPERAAGRARQVLAAMVDAGFLSRAEADAAERHKGALVAAGGDRTGSRYFVDWVLERVPDFVSAGDKDLIVTTTLDPQLQRIAEKEVAEVLSGPGAKAAVSQAALVAMTPGGAVRVMVGGRDYRRSQFNRAVQAFRQPGSAFKPFVYLAGLEAGLTPEDRVVDAPLSIGGWRPRNFNGRYGGEVSLREALARSINTVAVRVSEQAGRRRVIDVSRRLGITAPLRPTPSLALGAQEVSLIELTGAYAVIANGGTGVWPYGILSIRDRDGRLLYRRQGTGPGRMIAARDAAMLSEMLASVIDNGTGRAARLARPVAGKTGTSQDYRDAWFVGFSADLVSGVWMGNDDGRSMKRVTGGGLPARLWKAFMAAAHRGLPVRPLPAMAPPPRRPTPPPARIAAPRRNPPQRNFFERLMDAFASEES